MLSDIWAIHNILLRVFFFLSPPYLLRNNCVGIIDIIYVLAVTDCLLNLFLKTSIDLLIRKKSIQQISFIHSRQPSGETEENCEDLPELNLTFPQ